MPRQKKKVSVAAVVTPAPVAESPAVAAAPVVESPAPAATVAAAPVVESPVPTAIVASASPPSSPTLGGRRRRPGAGRPPGSRSEKMEIRVSQATRRVLEALVSLGQGTSPPALAGKLLAQKVEALRSDLRRTIDGPLQT